ncbi:MAG: hypothetical protein QXE05_07905 [Nitrososphaeria archaeon]
MEEINLKGTRINLNKTKNNKIKKSLKESDKKGVKHSDKNLLTYKGHLLPTLLINLT